MASCGTLSTTNVFGILASGRLVRTDFTQIDPTHFTIIVNDAGSLHHIAVFLTGESPFPDGTAGLIYLSWMQPGSVQDNWILLGSISNTKPSAMFKINSKDQNNTRVSTTLNFMGVEVAVSECTAKIGISVEPIASVEMQVQQLLSNRNSANANASASASDADDIAKKVVTNLFNYATSYAVLPKDINVLNSMEPYVPLKAIQTWYQNIERRMGINPGIWK